MPLRRATSALVCAISIVVASCAREPVAAPRIAAGDEPAYAGKPATTPSVGSTNPPYGDRGKTIDVHILGSGFTTGAKANWLLHGVADPGRIRTNSTTFVSSTELVANITIADDAELAFWDVQVALLGGKGGVGTELFEVTSAQLLGPGTLGGSAYIYDISDQRQVVGYSTSATGTAFFYDDQLGLVPVGAGQAWAVDPFGTMVLGRNNFATAWVRQPNNSWVAEELPRTGASVSGNVSAAARAPDGTLILAGWDALAGARRNDEPVNRPALWYRSGSGWSAPTIVTFPAGVTRGSARGVNGLGQLVGRLDGTNVGAVWDTPSTPVRLDGLPNAINANGTIIVGERNGAAVYWLRGTSGAWNTTASPLPSIAGAACTGGAANDVNNAGVIVGASCNVSGKTQATVWHLDLTGAVPVVSGSPAGLPGLGERRNTTMETSSAAAVTESAPYVAAGGVVSNGTRLAVRWRLP